MPSTVQAGEKSREWRAVKMKNAVLVTVLALGIGVGTNASAEYSILDLGSLGGRAWAYDLNNTGQVVGSSYLDASDTDNAFVFTPGVGMKNLGTLGGTVSRANGINDSGQVVGFSQTTNNAARRAFVSNPGGGMTELGGNLFLSDSFASAINSRGEIAGTNYYGNRNSAVVWSSTGRPRELGTLGRGLSGYNGSYANDINESGQVVGWSSYSGGDSIHAFVYTPGIGMKDLGTFGGSQSLAYAINDVGQVLGNANTWNNYSMPVFLYTPGLGMQNLGAGSAVDLNNLGQVLLGDDFYSADTGRVTLKSLLPAGSGWDWITGGAINDLGQIAGTGWRNGEQHAFLMNPATLAPIPEPSMYAMMLAGLGVLGLARRRKQSQS